MKTINASIRNRIEQNRSLFTMLRRSDVVMQFRQCMTAKGIKGADVAERLGVSEANVSRWLKGNQNLRIDTLYLLADAIEEPLSLIVGKYEIGATQASFSPSNGERGWDLDSAGDGQAINLSDRTKLKSLLTQGPLNEPTFALAQSDTGISFTEDAYERSTVAA